MVLPRSTLLKKTLTLLAPGTELRDGLERILQGRTGALIVLGNDRTVDAIGTGGFDIAIDFTGTRLRELAKMDGAIICDREVGRILRAGIHLMPDPSIPTEESGTRHRTAERVARQTGFPVISVSKSMGIITIYVDGERYPLEGSQAIMARANQAIQTLERYTERLEQEFANLSALEIESDVTVRNVAATLQRLELVRRITEEIAQSVMELGVDGRMISMQLEELVLNRPDADTVLMTTCRSSPPPPPSPRPGWPWPPWTPASSRIPPRWPAAWAWWATGTWTTRSHRGATGCWRASPRSRASSRTASWTASTDCRPSWPPTSRTSRAWRASASTGLATSGSRWRAWRSRACSSGSCDRGAPGSGAAPDPRVPAVPARRRTRGCRRFRSCAD